MKLQQPRVANISYRVLALSVLIGILFVLGCAVGGSSSSRATVTYNIGGTVSGLSGTGLVLQDNGGNNLTVSANGSFTFTAALSSGTAYSVTVFSQPSNPAQTCGVTAGGSGTVASANVTSVVVTCITIYTIGGTVSGLSGTGLVLQNNVGNNLSVSANGSFTFTTAIASGGSYNVTVFSQPSSPAQTCGVTAGGSGTVASANVTSVVVTCIGSAGFVLTGSMTAARDEHTATLLNNGNVLVAGGFNSTTAIASAELYDPATGSFTVTGSMTAARVGYTATLLNNGMVLIAGGDNAVGIVASAELYNPATGSFTATGSMTSPRYTHTATLLNNGKVLIAGGVRAGGDLASAELYDPATGTFTATGSMTSARDSHTAMLLNDGNVLVAGGYNPTTAIASAELYDPATGSFTATGSMTAARSLHTATLLNNGNVLVVGGISSPTVAQALASGELYNPSTGSFTATGSMISARCEHTATLLNDGNVLVAGGYNPTTGLAGAELYDPATGTFTATGSMTSARFFQTATLLNDGNVLVAGGANAAGGGPVASAELYLPGTLTPTGLVSITVTPATPTLSVGSTQQFIATGTFSDSSTQNLQSVTWSSSNQAAGTITNDASDHGVALALAAGKSTITASAGSISGSTVLTVQ
jgi:Bacterial Ig-like domain (group 2)/Galactose oxidase, central domain